VRRIACLLGAVLGTAAALALAHRVVAYRIEDLSMQPALQPGDWVLGLRRRQACRGEVVVFDLPQRPGFKLVKRVAAAPGERVEGTALGPDEFWVLGDNPAAGSVDSHVLGPIPLESLRARLLWRYRPWPPARVR
jgi:signal peptidase I